MKDLTVKVWFTSEDLISNKMTQQSDLAPVAINKRLYTKIYIDPDVQYQTIDGIGSSLEEASIYNLSKMRTEFSDQILKNMFDSNDGMGWSLIRITFGSSDFTSQNFYTYDDTPGNEPDPELKHFSIQKDIDLNILSYLKKAFIAHPHVKLIASPWSPPAWMKSSKSLCGGSVLPEYYEVLAKYYAKSIRAYDSLGIPIYAFSVQNEPFMETVSYPSCTFSWEEERDFVVKLKKEFVKNRIKTKILILDHDFDMAMSFAGEILKDKKNRKAYDAVDGIAFHDYGGEPSEMSTLHYAFPDKDIFFTERSTWGTKGLDRIIQYLRNWSKTYCAWVTCLTDQSQPNRGFHKANPTFVVVDSKDPDSFRYIPEYYLLSHLTRFVKPGACRIQSNYGALDAITNAAFLNPDRTIVMIAVNQNTEDHAFKFIYQDMQFNSTLPAKTAATYLWKHS